MNTVKVQVVSPQPFLVLSRNSPEERCMTTLKTAVGETSVQGACFLALRLPYKLNFFLSWFKQQAVILYDR